MKIGEIQKADDLVGEEVRVAGAEVLHYLCVGGRRGDYWIRFFEMLHEWKVFPWKDGGCESPGKRCMHEVV